MEVGNSRMNNVTGENTIVSTSEKWMTNSDTASQIISKYTTSKNSGGIASNKRRMPACISKDDEEYAKKRERNNVAVKKSREKAKHRIHETQVRVEQLSKENEELQTKVTLLSKELNVLRALFTNGGFTLPAEFQFSDSHSSVGSDRHSPPMMESVSHRLDDSHSPRVPSHHSSAISIKQESSKSAFHSMDESKIPPLRPMPRVANSPSNKSELHSPIRSYEGVLQSSRESLYSPYKSSSHYSSSEKPTSSIVMMPHGQSSSSYSSSHYGRSPPETQHTSVIRSSAELVSASNSSSSSSNNLPSQNNKLGTFCIIQDPENNGAVKIVPINS